MRKSLFFVSHAFKSAEIVYCKLLIICYYDLILMAVIGYMSGMSRGAIRVISSPTSIGIQVSEQE